MARRALTFLAILLLVGGAVTAQENATLWGLVLDRAGNPLPGYAVVLENSATHASVTSPVSDTGGQYQVVVPATAAYKPIAVISRGGARFAIEGGMPVQARRAVRYRLDVIVPDVAKQGAEAPHEAGATQTSTGPTANGSEPWWKTPGGIAAIVGIQGAILAVFLTNDNNDEPAASPSQP